MDLEAIEEFCPAKINLFLAVTGRREDGFHELVSLVAPVDVGDRLRLAPAPNGKVSFHCSDPSLPTDERNLVLRAVEVFRQRHPFDLGLSIELEKRIPVGAGLGGGSSDAAGLLLGLNRLLGKPLRHGDLHPLAAAVGSDCPFFLEQAAVIMRGRGECIEPLSKSLRGRLRGRKFLLVKPTFGVSTAWAYGAMAARGGDYSPAPEAERRLAEWMEAEWPLRQLLFNNLEPAVFAKYVPLAVVKKKLTAEAGLPVLMTGSGSALFIPIERDGQEDEARKIIGNACGESAWIAGAALL